MANYRLHMEISYNCIDSVAYGTRSRIENVTTGEVSDYSLDHDDAVYSRTFLCKNAPAAWQDPSVLWNEVAKVEKAADARQARTFEGSIPAEFIGHKYLMYSLVNEMGKAWAEEGMCCTITIHEPDKDNPNWHFHSENTMRKVDEKGKFEPKSKKIYEYEKDEFGNIKKDKDGKEIKLLMRDKNGNVKRDKAGHIQYVCHKKNLDNGWSTDKKLEEWRKRWADVQNKYLERAGFDVTVSEKSYAAQGCILPPLPRLSRKDWEKKEAGGTNAAIEHWHEVQAERQRIREENPELFDKNGKQIMHINAAITALEEQKAELEKAIELEAAEAARSPISEDTPEIQPEIPTPQELGKIETQRVKEPRENASVSPDLPAVEHITPTTETELEEEEEKDYTVLHIHDIFNKITGYVKRVCEILEEVVKSKTQPEETFEQSETEDTITTDIYKYYDDAKEADIDMNKLADEARQFNQKTKHQHAVTEQEYAISHFKKDAVFYAEEKQDENGDIYWDCQVWEERNKKATLQHLLPELVNIFYEKLPKDTNSNQPAGNTEFTMQVEADNDGGLVVGRCVKQRSLEKEFK